MKKYRSIVLVVVAAILVSACGIRTNNTTNPSYVAKQFWDAMIREDFKAARQYVTENTRAQVKPGEANEEDKRWYDVVLGASYVVDDEAMVDTITRTFPGGTKKGEEDTAKGVAKVSLKTIMIRQKDGQWLIDFSRSMISVFGGGYGKLQTIDI